jgi:hypothetical protein
MSLSEKEAVINFARTLGMSTGDIYFIYTESSFMGHGHKAVKEGERIEPGYHHHDGWAVRYDGFSYSIAKIHSDDFERGATPYFEIYY